MKRRSAWPLALLAPVALTLLLLAGRWVFAGAALWLLGVARWDREGLRGLGRARFWCWSGGLTIVAGLVLGKTDRIVGCLPISLGGLEAGCLMTARALLILSLSTVAGRRLDARRLVGLTARVGMPHLGAALGLAMNVAPLVGQSVRMIPALVGLRGGDRLRWWRRWWLVAVTVLTRTALLAEDAAASWEEVVLASPGTEVE